MFQSIPSTQSGIEFSNIISENDSINVLDYEYVYNGGGVAVGDFNNDGLPDIYFTGNMVNNRLYLNMGNFKFYDITDTSGTTGGGKWCTGVAVVDINNDGWLDMYVCATRNDDAAQRENLLYINQGTDKNGIPVFKEQAADYGLADTSYAMQAAFFDYDNDGDLDMYLLVAGKVPKGISPNTYKQISRDAASSNTGKLFRNDWNDSLKHSYFTDVSAAAGISLAGYGLGVNITDINKDGWKDILISNDYISNDLLWINNGDGTFTNKAAEYFKHTSFSAMGNDVVDINNDGLVDIIELDMSPEDNYRKKMMLNANSYHTYQNFDHYGYQYQYTRNALQVNQGPRVLQNDSIGAPVFNEIGFLAGISETDWSWAPLVIDFNNDGYRDIIITNGFRRDLTDHDFISFRDNASAVASKQQLLDQLPEVKIPNYAFQNNGSLRFSNVSKEWGLNMPSFSNGAVYADLDNDGDMDLIINNINDEALIYKNNARENNKEISQYLQIQCVGNDQNNNGLGAWIEIYYDKDKQQVYENTPYRGYLSSVQNLAHFGLGKVQIVDSVVIKWPDGKMQVLQNIKADQLLKLNQKDAQINYSFSKDVFAKNTLFKEITDSVGIHFLHQEKDFIDFNIQKLLPHKFSQYTPAIAAGDIDGNGLDDLIVGGSSLFPAQLFLQQTDGHFTQKDLYEKTLDEAKFKDAGILLFDADGDGDSDLYFASGGYEYEPNTAPYQDRMYVNDGKGNFTLVTNALPENFTSKLCVRAIDFDRDGDLDLFVSGRVEPWNYPKPVSSFILRNDSKNGQIKFTDVTNEIAKDLTNIGLVSDALFTDFDNDGWSDLIIAGEWMPVTFLKNDKGVFKNITASTGISKYTGWWHSIVAGDFDNDGDMDYIIGNLGENSFYKASDKYPVGITAKDIDNNGIYDAFPSLFLPVSQQETHQKEFPAQTRDDVLKQVLSLRAKFPSYKSFAKAGMDEVLSHEQRKGALRLEANYMKSVFLSNDGNGKFTLSALPLQAQMSVLNGMVVDDFDGDGNLDVVISGNDYGTEVSVGRYDALNGLMLKGDGKGNFIAQTILESGVYIPGDGKALVKLRSNNGKYLLAASQNRGVLKLIELKRNMNVIPLQPFDVSAIIQYKNGDIQRREFDYGSSFLSQSGRFLSFDQNVASIEVTDSKGNKRNQTVKGE